MPARSRPRSTMRGSSPADPGRPAAAVPRRVRVEHVMGTTVSIDVRPPLVDAAVLDAVVAWFHDVDDRFSPYRPDSEVSRIGSGALARDDASPDVRAMFTLADELRDLTGGFFDPRAHRADGRPDPTGVVKGWAVDEALATLRLAGARNVQVNAGGDLVAAGEPEPGRAWRIGIRHPDLAGRVAAVLGVRAHAGAPAGAVAAGAPHGAPPPGRPPPCRRRPRGRDVRAVRAWRTHRRPPHGTHRRRAPQPDRRRAPPGHRGRVRHRRLRDGGGGDRLGRPPARVRRRGDHPRRPRCLDAARPRPPRSRPRGAPGRRHGTLTALTWVSGATG